MIYNGFKNRELSEIGFGTWGLSGDWEKEKIVSDRFVVQSLLGLAYERGINLFDTAPVYGQGYLESLIGELSWKNDVLISTKVPAKVKPTSQAQPLDHYYDDEYTQKSVVSSLERLKRERIDLIQLHNWSREWNNSADYFLSPLQRLKESGVIGFIGISLPDNFASDIDKVLELGIVDFIQAPYNPLQRWPETYLFEQCRKKGVYLLLRSPFVHGLLTEDLLSSKVRINDKRLERVPNLDQLRALVQDWFAIHGGNWTNINDNIIESIRGKITGRGTVLIGMRQPEQIIANTKR